MVAPVIVYGLFAVGGAVATALASYGISKVSATTADKLKLIEEEESLSKKKLAAAAANAKTEKELAELECLKIEEQKKAARHRVELQEILIEELENEIKIKDLKERLGKK